MTPPKSCHLNGPRPSPLQVHRDSRLIRKPSPPPQLRQPLIIYTHSPKIIHTQPKDFMALVQRLTGCTPPNADKPSSDRNFNDNDSSSVLTDEENNIDDDRRRQRVVVKEVQSNSSSFLSDDVPLFTPRSSVLRYSSDLSPFSSPGLVNSLSPSFMEFLKGLPEF